MAIIYTYPTVIPEASDILLGTETNATLRQPTKNFKVSELAKFIIDSVSGTSLDVPLFFDVTDPTTGLTQTTLVNSIMSQDANPAGTTITVAGNLEVTGTLEVDAALQDSTGSTGTANQQLVSTGTATQWKTQTGIFAHASALVWTITHNGEWGPYPSVTVINNNDVVLFGEVEYLSTTQLKITFSATFAGTAYLN
tara:strand:- start:1442 stop:2029 length:588 start_codon:yes stop_codon:yes gene_type:complete